MSSYKGRFLLLSFLGLVLSSVLIFHHTSVKYGYQSGSSFCSVGPFDCDPVVKSAFSELFRIPVAGYAFAYYLVFLAFLFLTKSKPAEFDSKISNIVLVYTFLSLSPSLGLLLLSIFVIKSFCLFCCLLDLINLCLFILAIRSPYRNHSLTQSFKYGSASLVDVFFPWNKESINSWFAAFLLWSTLIIGIVVAFLSPSLLIRFYFEPRRIELSSGAALQNYINKWEASPYFEIAVNTDINSPNRDFIIGSPTAPITIVEFSDFECPYCKKAAQNLEPFVHQHKDKIRLVFKNYPLDQSCNRAMGQRRGHLFSCSAAKNALCAGIQGDSFFWKMHDAIFGLSEVNESTLADLPAKVGLDIQAFQSCMSNPSTDDRLLIDLNIGAALRIQGTPSIFVNGKSLQAPPDYIVPTIVQIIKKLSPPGNP